jgi:hypothetical protein
MRAKYFTKHLTSAALIAVSCPAFAAIKVPVYQAVPPTANVVGLKTISMAVTGDQGGIFNADIRAEVNNKDLGKAKMLGMLSDMVGGVSINVGDVAGDLAASAGVDPTLGGTVDLAKSAADADLSVDLGSIGGLRDLPIYEAPVDIMTLTTVDTGGEIQITGTAFGKTEVVSAGTQKAKNRNNEVVTLKCVQKTATVVYDVDIVSNVGAAIGKIAQTAEHKAPRTCMETKKEAEAAVPDDASMFELIRKKAVGRLIAMVKPMWRKVALKLEKDQNIADAVRSIKGRSDVAQSVAKIMKTHQTDPYNYPAAFSVAVLMEMYGDLERAQVQFEKAGKLKQTKLQGKALIRVQNRIREADLLLAMGLKVRGTLPVGDGE